MPTEFACPECGSQVVGSMIVPGDLADCPGCGKEIVVPDQEKIRVVAGTTRPTRKIASQEAPSNATNSVLTAAQVQVLILRELQAGTKLLRDIRSGVIFAVVVWMILFFLGMILGASSH